MSELDIFDVPKQRYFDYGDDSEVLIEYAGKEILIKIGEKAAEISRKTGMSVGHISNRLIGKKVVKGWRKKSDHSHPGLTISGCPIDFTPQNLDMLMTRSTEFSNFVNVKCIEAAAFRAAMDVDLDSIAQDLFGDNVESAEKAGDSKNVSERM